LDTRRSSRKIEIIHYSSIPGPGKYNVSEQYKVVKPNTPRYSMGGRRSDDSVPIGHEIPGPSKYNPPATLKYKKAPKYTFSGRQKSNFSWDETPGPAAYTLPSTRQKSKITMKGRWKTKKKSVTPGPNQYAPTRGARPHSARAVSMRARIPAKDEMIDTPGPNMYNPIKKMGYQKQK